MSDAEHNFALAEEFAAKFPGLKVSCARGPRGHAFASHFNPETGLGFTATFDGPIPQYGTLFGAMIDFKGKAADMDRIAELFALVVGK